MSQFIKMTKDGEEIAVVPSLVDEHKLLGWEVVDPAPDSEATSESGAEKEPSKAGAKKAISKLSAKK
jgi:hypothetical protein